MLKATWVKLCMREQRFLVSYMPGVPLHSAMKEADRQGEEDQWAGSRALGCVNGP